MIQPVKMLKFKRGWLLQMVNDPKHAFKTRLKQKTIMRKNRCNSLKPQLKDS